MRRVSENDNRLKSLEHRVDELYDLLNASRELSNIFNPRELYSVISQIISAKTGIEEISIFLYRRKSNTFRLVYSRKGLAYREYLFQEVGSFWQKLIQNQPFPTVDPDTEKILYPDLLERFNLDAAAARLLVPLMMRNRVIGFIALGARSNAEPFSDKDLYFLRHIASHAAVCINTSLLYLRRKKEKEELDRTLYNLSLLYSIGRAMTYISDLKSLLKYILNQAVEITGAEKGSIMLYDIETNRLTVRVLAGLKDKAYQKKVNNNEIQCRSFKPGEGIAGRVFQNGRPMVVDKASEDALFIEAQTSFVRSIACIPMMVYKEVVGVINVTNKKNGENFTDEDVELLKAVADQAAVAINKAQLWEMAVTDSLTGLFVRRYFMVKFQEEFHRAERYKKILSVVMADLDRFKKVNDDHGHAVGDRVLKLVARFLEKNVRDVDILARYGGEEFVILLPEADKEEAHLVSERLRQKLAEHEVEGLPPLTMSLGVASYPEDGADVEMLIKKADAALYAAKQAGRNRVVRYDDSIKLNRLNSDSDSKPQAVA